MKYLEIKDNKGSYRIKGGDYRDIDKISKEDLLVLLNKIIDKDFEMDIFEEEKIENKAHRIIYKNIYEKFKEILDNKPRFKDESEQLYKQSISEYSGQK